MERYLSAKEKEAFTRLARSYHLTLVMGWSLSAVLAFFVWNLYPLAAFVLIVILFNAYVMIRYEIVLLRIYGPLDLVDVLLGLYTDDTADQPKQSLTRVLGIIFFVLGLAGIITLKALTLQH